jgi:hypothetical protein
MVDALYRALFCAVLVAVAICYACACTIEQQLAAALQHCWLTVLAHHAQLCVQGSVIIFTRCCHHFYHTLQHPAHPRCNPSCCNQPRCNSTQRPCPVRLTCGSSVSFGCLSVSCQSAALQKSPSLLWHPVHASITLLMYSCLAAAFERRRPTQQTTAVATRRAALQALSTPLAATAASPAGWHCTSAGRGTRWGSMRAAPQVGVLVFVLGAVVDGRL